ncbi:hypothetical protein HYS28_01540 [Candidatus Uhrbacteria bacterium]|nr:hypothetical protein [Candidatus Uhrbacteria bacterium]
MAFFDWIGSPDSLPVFIALVVAILSNLAPIPVTAALAIGWSLFVTIGLARTWILSRRTENGMTVGDATMFLVFYHLPVVLCAFVIWTRTH